MIMFKIKNDVHSGPKEEKAKSNGALVSIKEDKRMMKLLHWQTEKRNFKRNKFKYLGLFNLYNKIRTQPEYVWRMLKIQHSTKTKGTDQ